MRSQSGCRSLLAGGLLLCAGLLIDAAPGFAQSPRAPGDAAAPGSGAVRGAESSGTWRLLRTPNAADGHNAISMVQTADISHSDLEFAGLMLHCGPTQPQVLIVLIRPLPPRTHPRVTVTAGGASAQFTASVVSPGALVLLPPEAMALASGPWQAAPELAVVVKDDSTVIRGAVSLTGLGAALEILRANCASR